jgi:hypothetical protein
VELDEDELEAVELPELDETELEAEPPVPVLVVAVG